MRRKDFVRLSICTRFHVRWNFVEKMEMCRNLRKKSYQRRGRQQTTKFSPIFVCMSERDSMYDGILWKKWKCVEIYAKKPTNDEDDNKRQSFRQFSSV